MRPQFKESVKSVCVEEQHSLVRCRMKSYDFEAAEFLDGANVSDKEDRDEEDSVRFADLNHVNRNRENDHEGTTAQRQVEAVGEG